jgi:hypothetical protein
VLSANSTEMSVDAAETADERGAGAGVTEEEDREDKDAETVEEEATGAAEEAEAEEVDETAKAEFL